MTKEQKVVALATEQEKHKVVQVTRKYLKQLAECRLNELDAASSNIDVLWQVGEKLNCKDLIHAVFAKDLLESKEGRKIIFSYIDNPLEYVEKQRKRIEQFKEYLK